MFASLRALLAGIVDYAGLFPPAKLPLDEAIRNYARYRQGPDAWMLGRFICPAARLGELNGHAELSQDGPPFAFSALGRGGNSAIEFRHDGLRADLADIAAFRERHGGRVTVDALEARLPVVLPPPGVLPNLASLAQLLSESAELLRAAGLSFFGEFPPGIDPALLDQVLRQCYQGLACPVGLKVRCGGMDASSFPSANWVAGVLRACRSNLVPFKATAGLHHPFPHFDPNLRATPHGFISLFAAGVLTEVCGLSQDEVIEALTADGPDHFVFDNEGLGWNGEHVTTAEIAAARRSAVLSFGSCSFDEPRDALRALGWL